jgi:glutathionylspermidine synthase
VTDATPRSDAFLDWAERLRASGLVPDPWCDGLPRFREEPLVIAARVRDDLYAAAEQITACHEVLVRLLQERPELLGEAGLGLTPMQRLMWTASAPLWHGMARADVFLTADGPRVCELNCDTPTGQSEAVVSSALAQQDRPGLVDPNQDLGSRFVRMVEDLVAARGGAPLRSVGIVYPTELTEDLSMITLVARWLEQGGFQVCLGSPFNLQRGGPTGLRLLDVPCDVVFRHYKTDWWGEREPVWLDGEPFSDPAPLVEPLQVLLRATVEGRVTVVNPFGAVVPQNKRAMALLWELQHELPAWAGDAVRRWLPPTFRIETLPPDELAADRAGWVLKSDYGCEGEEVLVGTELSPDEWAAALQSARPGRWIAQRRFEALCDGRGEAQNHGVYVVAGEACGLLCRSQCGPTDYAAAVVPALVEEAS